MTNEGRDDPGGMEQHDDEALWALLGRQEAPATASPFLSRRVLREIAQTEEAHAAGWWGRLRRKLPSGVFARRGALWSGVFSGVCAVGLLVLTQAGKTPGATELSSGKSGLAEQTLDATPATTPQAVPAETAPATSPGAEAVPTAASDDDVEIIADLDNVLQREESRLWTEDIGRF